jgi:hypothetical protein
MNVSKCAKLNDTKHGGTETQIFCFLAVCDEAADSVVSLSFFKQTVTELCVSASLRLIKDTVSTQSCF